MRDWSWLRPWESDTPWYVYYGTAIACDLIVVGIGFMVYLAVDAPSCEEQGKRNVFQYFMPLVQMVGTIPVTQLMPVYACQ